MTVEATLIVANEEAIAGFVPKVPVIPAGQLDAASVTALLKPLVGTIVTVDVPEDPTAALAVVALIEKVGAAVTVREIGVVLESVTLVPFTVSK